ncbi:MAG: hypothetical protein KF725_10560 [Cyclobacteriaceae bacterium]|nr:hypothetical protein [Cyclobacteriaceae bacterium]UYN86151.1 MAG: hypothetical protein KIT51_14955 [Cyclobacteriaceae bacterium]HMP31828.1 hypothetical protein [Saprospiraceae bacterium]
MAGNLQRVVTGSWSLLLLLLLSAKCNEEKDPEFVFMTFEIPITINPTGETLTLGDTLWINGQFSDTLLDIHSGKYFKLKNFDFKSKICISRINNNQLYTSQQQPAFNEFSYYGDVYQTSSICGPVTFNYSNGQYFYKVALIPKNTGVFNIFVNRPVDLHGFPDEQIDLVPYINLGVASDGRKKIPVYEAFLFIVNNGSTNFELFKQYAKPGTDIVPSEEKGSFTFRVVE